MANPTLTQYLNLISELSQGSTSYPGFTVITSSSSDSQIPTATADGFSAVALRDNSTGNVIVVNQGFFPNPLTTLGRGAFNADSKIFLNQTPAALVDARDFAEQIEALVTPQTGPSPAIYVDGNSLGGAEAEAEAEQIVANNLGRGNFAGGATFGAPGLPENTLTGPTSLVNYIIYSDAVASYATDSGDPLATLFGPGQHMQHYGTQYGASGTMLGNPQGVNLFKPMISSFASNDLAGSAANGGSASDVSFFSAWSDLGLLDSAVVIHHLPFYAADLGVTLSSSPDLIDMEIQQLFQSFGAPFGSQGEVNAGQATIASNGNVVTPDLTGSYNATTNQIVITQTQNMSATAIGTVDAGGVTTLSLDSSTGAIDQQTYASPDGTVYTASVDETAGNITSLKANENNGASYQTNYTYNPDMSVDAVTTGYAGTNLTGTLQFTQTTNISSSGDVISDIAGTGANVALDNATITLEPATGATSATDSVTGSGNTISAGTSSTSPGPVALTLSGTDNTVTLGAGSSISDSSADLATDTITFDLAQNKGITLDAGVFSGSSFTNSGTMDIALVTQSGTSLGTLAINTATGATSFTVALSGLTITLPAITANSVITAPTDPTDTPEDVLLSYLGDLGGPSSLTTLNHNYLVANGTVAAGYTVTQFNALSGLTGTGLIDAVSGGVFNLATNNPNADYNMVATDWSGTTLQGNTKSNEQLVASLFGDDTLKAGSGTGDTLTAGEGVDTLIGSTVGSTFFVALNGLAYGSTVSGKGNGNTLQVSGDISGDDISGVQTLNAGNITLTADQFNSFTTINAGTINAAVGGVYDLTSLGTSSSNMTALSNDGTTLISNGGGTLTASALGDDTLKNGTTLVAGGGIDTLENGTTAIATNGLAVGSVVENVTTLETSGDLSLDTITGVTTLALTGGDSVTLTSGQFNGLTTLQGPAGSELLAESGGTYNLTNKLPAAVFGGDFDMTALSNAGTTLEEDSITGASVNDVILTASEGGSDTLISNGSYGVTLDADDSTGNVTLTSISGTGNDLSVEDSTGNDTLTATGLNDVLDALGSTGNVTLTGINGSTVAASATFYAGNGTDTIIGGASSTIYSGGGTDTIYAAGVTVIDEGSGTDTIYTNGGLDTITGGTGNDTYVINASVATGTSIVGGGGNDTLNVASAFSYDISEAAITGVQSLVDNADLLTLNASELSQFTSLSNPFSSSQAATLVASTAGTYSLAGKTVTGNFELSAATTSANVTLIGNNQNNQILVAGSGTDTLQAGSGTGDLLIGGAGTTTFIVGGTGSTAQISLASAGVTFSSGAELIALADPDTIEVQAGKSATIVGSDGTTTVNNDASGGIEQNITNWTAGGSEVQTLTAESNGSVQEVDTEFSGSNGGGTYQYTQTITTTSSGAVSGAIYGVGEVVSYSNATLALGSSSSATFNGSNDSVAGGNNDTITLSSATSSDFTFFGSNDTANLEGTNDSATAYGNDNIINLTGTGDTAVDASPSTGGNSFSLTGNSEGASLAESGDTGTLSGNDDTATLYAGGESLTVSGTGDTVTDVGTGSNTISITGSHATAYISNSSDVTTVGGTENVVYLFDNNTTLTLNGTYNTGVAYGSDDTINVNGSNDTGNDYGTNGDQVIIEGSGDNAIISKNGDSSTISGSHNTAEIVATDDTLSVSGNDNALNDYVTTGGNAINVTGSGNSVGTYNNDTITFSSAASSNSAAFGSGCTINDGGTDDSSVAYGNGNTINLSGNSDYATDASPSTGGNSFVLSGTSDTANLGEAGETATVTGSGNTIISRNGSDTINVQSGSNNFAEDLGTGSTITLNGTSNEAQLNDSGMLTMGGSSNFAYCGSSDTVTVGGTSNNFTIYGDANTVTLTGGSDSLTDANTAGANTVTLSGSSETAAINDTASDTLTLSGSNDTVNVNQSVSGTATATLSGTGDMLKFAGATSDSIVFSGSAINELILGSASSFAGTVAGMGSSDSIDLANFLFSGTPTISSVTGTGATGTYTDVTITDGSAHVMLALLNQATNQFAVNASAYTLKADGTGSNAGTLFEIAPGH